MFSKTIVGSDAFIDMPMSARLLYFDLGMNGDDDGFVNSPKKIMKISGSSDDDLKILIAKKFIIPFESGVVVIKHWKLNNLIRSDRYIETNYKEEKALLQLDANNSYRLHGGIPTVYQMDTNGIPRLGKDRIEEVSIVEVVEEVAATKSIINPYQYYEQNIGTISPLIIEKIQASIDDIGEDLMCYAIEEAVTHNVKAWKYIEAIVLSWKDKGIKTRLDADNLKPKPKSKDMPRIDFGNGLLVGQWLSENHLI